VLSNFENASHGRESWQMPAAVAIRRGHLVARFDARGVVRPVLLPPHASGRRVFDDTLGNKLEKLDLEACVMLPDARFVAFGSGSTTGRGSSWCGAARRRRRASSMPARSIAKCAAR
jgi:hypothetical protein